MNMETRLIPNVQMNQQLSLAPQLLQWLRLLQLPTMELSTLIHQELEINPTLELDDDEPQSADNQETPDQIEAEPSIPEPESEITSFNEENIGEKFELLAEMDNDWSDTPAPMLTDFAGHSEAAEEKRRYMMESLTSSLTLSEHLMSQVGAVHLSNDEHEAAVAIIGSIDRRGYMTTALEEIAEIANVEMACAEKALSIVQNFDPPGVAARSLSECLLLQVRDRNSLVARMIRDYLEALARGQFAEIANAVGVTKEDVLEAFEIIRSLKPEPGTTFSSERTRYISADITVHKAEGDFIIEVNDDSLPRIRISSSCRQIMDTGRVSGEDLSYLRKKIRSASFLIQGIRQRQETLRKVACEIVKHQMDYLDSETAELKPLTMATVAKAIGVHETTVSRALSQKYMRIPHGLFEMKHFFKAGYQCADGTAVVPSTVQDMISGLVKAEEKSNPLTDLHIVRALKAKGINIARRTIAKYREEMGIGSSKERLKKQAGARLVLLNNVQPDQPDVFEEQSAQRVYA